MLKIRKGDDVIVRSGKYKGQKGVVERVIRSENKVVVKDVNVVKRHVGKKITGGNEGTILEVSKPIRMNIVALMGKDGKPTRVRFEERNGSKVRVATKDGSVI